MAVIGGAGDMAQVAVQRLLDLRSHTDVEFVLADRDIHAASRRAAAFGPRVSAVSVDLFDPHRLHEVVAGTDLVINATGPYYRTGRPVLEAAIDAGTDYIDFGDDVEAADVMLGLDRAARDAGVTALIGAGIAPGLVNVVAKSLADRLDVAESVQLAWVTGSSPHDPGAPRGGRAVLEHMLHSCTGVTFTIEGGHRRTIPAFRHGQLLEFPEPLGRYRVYDLGHAELATIPRFMPTVTTVRTQGGLYPPALNGVFQGFGHAVSIGRLDWQDAVDALVALDSGDRGSTKAGLSAIRGILAQATRRELRARDLRTTLAMFTRSNPGDSLGGLFVEVRGRHDGAPAGWRSSIAIAQSGTTGGMDDVTGTPLAAMAHLLLDGHVTTGGVTSPEAAVTADRLVATLSQLDFPDVADLFDPVVRQLGR